TSAGGFSAGFPFKTMTGPKKPVSRDLHSGGVRSPAPRRGGPFLTAVDPEPPQRAGSDRRYHQYRDYDRQPESDSQALSQQPENDESHGRCDDKNQQPNDSSRRSDRGNINQ